MDITHDCCTCKYTDLTSKDEPCYSCINTVKDYYEKPTCSDCAKKDAEIAELKIRYEAADAMNHELHKVNTELQGKLTAETKRADVAERLLSCDAILRNGICHQCSYQYTSDCAPTCLEGYREYAEQQLTQEADNASS